MIREIIILLAGLIILYTLIYLPSIQVVETRQTINNEDSRLTCSNCSIVLITIDTLRSDHLPCYGYRNKIAPNICKLAKSSILFTNAISQSSWTLPAHASILTGVYSHQHKAESFYKRDKIQMISTEYEYLPELLRQNGYSTAGFVSAFYVGPEFGFDRGFESFNTINAGSKMITSRRITDNAITWIEKTDDKFFLWLHYYDPHHKFRYHKMSDKIYTRQVDEKTNLKYKGWNVHPYNKKFFEKNREKYTTLYDGEIFFVDYFIQQIIDTLSKSGKMEDTILVITSDHGESFNEHGLVGHDNQLYANLINVPLIIHIPGARPRRINKIVETKDIMPTILESIGLEKPSYIQENSLFNARDFAFSEIYNRNKNKRISLVSDRYKLIYTYNDEVIELYDLKEDPGENHNIAEENKDIVEGLFKEMPKSLSENETIIESENDSRQVELPDDIKKRLKSLGYI